MKDRSLSWTTGLAGAACILAAAGLAAQQIMIQNSDVRVVNGGVVTNGQPDKPLEAGTGLILGQAIDAGSKRPVPGALATLSLGGYVPAKVLADAEGRFLFRELPPGRYSLDLSRPGYDAGAFGRTRPGGPTQSIDLAADQRLGDVSVPLWKYAAISGTVLDEHGEPLVGAQVRVLRQTIVAGKRQLQESGSDTADDRGIYRVGSLTPDDYIVVLPMTQNSSPLDGLIGKIGGAGGGLAQAVFFTAGANVGGGGNLSNMTISVADGPGAAGLDANTSAITDDGHVVMYPTTFYPQATTAARATLVTVGSGEDKQGVDFQVKPVRTAKVSGTVLAPDGPAGNLQVSLIPADTDDLVTPVGTPSAFTDGNGAFTFTSVMPGSYTLRTMKNAPMSLGDVQNFRTTGGGGTFVMSARVVTSDGTPPPLPTDPSLWAETAVQVGSADIANIPVTLRQTVRTSGTIAFVGSAVKPTGDRLASINVSLESADGRSNASARGRVDPNGTFQTMGVPPGKYLVRVNGAPQDWTFYGAMMGGKDVSIEPIEITSADLGGIALTFTDRPATLSGNVSTANGAVDPGASVLVFPTEPDGWIGHGARPRRLLSTRVAKDGSFTFSSIPPGRYFAVAIPDTVARDMNPKFLDALSRVATRLEVGDGEKKQQALKTVTPEVR